MKANELVAARMSGGITIVRVVDVEAARVRVAIRRKKQARIPSERIVLATQVFAEGDQQVADFRRRSEDIAADVDIAELWEVVSDEQTAMPFDDLAELYWGADATPAHQVALLLCLDRDSLYFEDSKAGYTPRTPDAVEETLARRKRQAQQAAEAAELLACLENGELPSTLTPHQRMHIDSMRDYAAFGDDYTRSGLVKTLLNKMKRKTGNLQRLAFDTLVSCGEFAPDEPIELRRDEIAEAFSDDALAAAEEISDAALLADGSRIDLTALPTITIDDADTRDRDDALSLERLQDEDDSAQKYRLGIHITDAGALIPQGSPLDEEANRRMSTLYIPDKQIPMLPPAVSHDKGSLDAGKRRAALSLLADISADGEILRYEVKPSIIISDAALSYDEANTAIALPRHSRILHRHSREACPCPRTGSGNPDDHGAMLATLHALTQALQQRREAAGAVGIDRPELLIKVVSSDDVQVKVVQRDSPARDMVAECMVLCNSLLAAFCRDNDVPATYRSQTAPDLTDLGADLPPGVDISEDGPLRQYLMLRRFAPAQSGNIAAPHGGLGVSAYIQATSPLRRYPDMVMQRQITHYLSAGEPLYDEDDITSVAGRADVQLRAMGKLEDERRRYWLLKYFKLRMSTAPDDDSPDDDPVALFKAVVLDNQPRRSAMLELTDYPFRVRARLPDAILPGETVSLRLHSVDLWEKRGSFIHAPDEG